ncbi:MAG: hypothetical protein QMD50_01185 [Patescibacteria group bacterium]|nr:hypothetical protein [Patescibacteria group bacterium]
MKKYIISVVISFGLVFYPSIMGIGIVFSPTNETAKAASASLESGYKTMTVWVTAYSSTPEETDDTPFITALGTNTRDGIVAANFLPFGTKILIPSLFGEKVFAVEDRMHRRKKNFIDIWMLTKEDAEEFGIQKAEIVVINPEISLVNTANTGR